MKGYLLFGVKKINELKRLYNSKFFASSLFQRVQVI